MLYSLSQKNPLRIFRTYWMISPKLFLNSKISCISASFRKEISILSYIAKKLQARQYLKMSYSSQGYVEKHKFLAYVRRKKNELFCLKILYFLSQILKIKMSDQLLKQIQDFNNNKKLTACNFFLYDYYDLEFSMENIIRFKVCPKNPQTFFWTPCMYIFLDTNNQ